MLKRLIGGLASALMAIGFPVIDHVVDSEGTIHVACVDIGPTLCVDGALFSDWQSDDQPYVVERSDLP